jgi:signal peptidase
MSAPHPLRRLWRIFGSAVFLTVVVLWFVFLRPAFLGGPGGFVVVSGTSMQPTMHSGDVVLTHREDSYEIGEVIAYRIPDGQAGAGRVVIHRIVGGSAAKGYVTRGDNRDSKDMWRPKPSDVLGRKQVHVPAAGRVARTILTPVGLGVLAGLAAFVLLLGGPAEKEPRGGGGGGVGGGEPEGGGGGEPERRRRRSREARPSVAAPYLGMAP